MHPTLAVQTKTQTSCFLTDFIFVEVIGRGVNATPSHPQPHLCRLVHGSRLCLWSCPCAFESTSRRDCARQHGIYKGHAPFMRRWARAVEVFAGILQKFQASALEMKRKTKKTLNFYIPYQWRCRCQWQGLCAHCLRWSKASDRQPAPEQCLCCGRWWSERQSPISIFSAQH